MPEFAHIVYKKKQPAMTYPSHICTICGKWEYEGADVCTTAQWICPECADRIKRLIYPKGGFDNV